MYVSTRELPEFVQSLLKKHGYHRPDISVVAKGAVSISDAGAAGQRAYSIVVNLETQQSQTHMGSWGGSNMFNPTNRVDLDTQLHVIPENGMVIKGSDGYRSYATIYVNPANIQRFLPPQERVSEPERAVLNAYQGLKSGLYRRQALERVANHEQVIAGLVKRGLLKQSKNGATRITTAGKNALGRAA
jgi:hypothetical protein